MYFLNVTIRNPIFNSILPVFDNEHAWRIPLILLYLSVLIFGSKRTRLIGLGALILILITDPVSSRILKPLFGRIRPCNVLANLNMWKEGMWIVIPDPVLEIYRGSFSMPSSHAANMGAQALWWGWTFWRSRWMWWGIGLTVGFSRIYDGVHWPADVLVGWTVAVLSFMLVWTVWSKLFPIIQPARLNQAPQVEENADQGLED